MMKKIVFYLILIIIPFILILVLESCLRLFNYGDNLKLFVKSETEGYLECNQKVAKRYFSKFGFTTPIRDIFLEKKPDNCYRIVVLGESTVIGFPYSANASFSRILRKRLQDLFPEKKIEVINLGITAINTYTLLDFTDEIIEQKPDLILIYAGHNEYYGALGVSSMENGGNKRWLKIMHMNLSHLKTYQMTQHFIAWLVNTFKPAGKELLQGTLMQQMVGNNTVPYKSEIYYAGINQFYTNMDELLNKYKKENIPVIISNVVSNIKDLPPFKSIELTQYPLADSVFNEAKKWESLHQFDSAKNKYKLAKELDAIRFRAPDEINKAIGELASKYNCPFVDMIAYFENASPNGIVGDNLMTEHLHPTIDGHFIMSEAFITGIKENKLISKNWDNIIIPNWHYYRENWGFTPLDSIIADLRIQHLKSGWPFKPVGTTNNFIYNYKPGSVEDSLAFMVVKYDDISAEYVHKSLAGIYEQNLKYSEAAKEYKALYTMVPEATSLYYKAAELMELSNNPLEAVKIYHDIPGYDTSYTLKLKCGVLFYKSKKYKRAIDEIKEIPSVIDKKIKIVSLKTLYNIYTDSGLTDYANQIKKEIALLDPSYTGGAITQTRIVVIPEVIKPYIDRAINLKKTGKLNEALKELDAANKIKETAHTNQLIGNILFSMKKMEALPYLEKAYIEIKDEPSMLNNLCVLNIYSNKMNKAEFYLNELKKLVGANDSNFKRLEAIYNRGLEKNKVK